MSRFETYIQLLGRRRNRRKISEKKYAKMLSQLMLWSAVVSYFDPEPDGGYMDDFWIDDEELEDDEED